MRAPSGECDPNVRWADWTPFADRDGGSDRRVAAGGPSFQGNRTFERYDRADPLAASQQRRLRALVGTSVLGAIGFPEERHGRWLPRGAGSVAPPPAEPAPEEGPSSETTTEWLEVRMVDTLGNPVADEPYRIRLPDGSVREGRLDADGAARLDGVEPGNCEVTFPELDAAEWRRA